MIKYTLPGVWFCSLYINGRVGVVCSALYSGISVQLIRMESNGTDNNGDSAKQGQAPTQKTSHSILRCNF